MRSVWAVLAVASLGVCAGALAGCAKPGSGGGTDLAAGNGSDAGGGGGDDLGDRDMAIGLCPGKDTMTDVMNCGGCNIVCNGTHVATSKCTGGVCVVNVCAAGYYDVNRSYTDGCECQTEASESAATNTCAGALTLTQLTDEPPSMVELTGNIVPLGDADWYQIQAIDMPDADNSCDLFNLKISFTQNPGDQFRFDILQDDCATAATCAGAGEQPVGLTTYDYTAGGMQGGYECPCSNSMSSPTVHRCTDNSQILRVRVYRKTGAPLTCDNYKLLVTNGM